jgi:hypothetical protein
MNVSNRKSDFVNVNEIRLRYLDWRGQLGMRSSIRFPIAHAVSLLWNLTDRMNSIYFGFIRTLVL